MANKKSTAERVAELTEKQQKTVARVGIWGTILLLAVDIPFFILIIRGFVTFITSPLSITRQAFIGWLALDLIMMVFSALYFVIIKVVFPYYSDRKALYILRNRKNKK